MKPSTALTLAALTTLGSALPTDEIKYAAPPGGWESIKYPAGTGANLPSYPAPPGGWESVKYPPGTGANLPSYPPAAACPPNKDIFGFTSTYHTVATPEQVVNANNTATGGLAGVTGYYDFGINAPADLICWNIRLVGFRGDYQSPARTATHIHEAARGKNGPPRLAFPNPQGSGNERFSRGCMTGPFTTGLVQNGQDTATGFKVAQIEANPAAFFADVHSSLAVPGAVRGQLA